MIINDNTVWTIDSNSQKWQQGVHKFWDDTIVCITGMIAPMTCTSA